MRIVLVSNIWNHHMAPVASALHAKLGDGQFKWILTEQLPLEQRRLGYDDAPVDRSWVEGPSESPEENQQLKELCLNADVAVMGSGPIAERVGTGKLTFIMGERLLKHRSHSIRMMLSPRYAASYRRLREMTRHGNAHALAIGYYAAHDLERVAEYGDRIWTWGYFTEVNPQPPAPRAPAPVNLLWAGRMLSWKRVDTLILALARVQNAPWFGLCTLVGEGEEHPRLLDLANTQGLNSGKVRFSPPVHHQMVRTLMQQSDIYVFPSSRKEGWGAALSEAMSEGCVPVANRAAGSTQVLVQDGKTGLLFDDGDVNGLARQLARLGTDNQLRMSLRRNSWDAMHTLWNADVAAERLIALIGGVEGGQPMPHFDTGPCAPATRYSGVL
jgi:glycosyltransferase involved in cell wall biosynthesis